MKPVGQFCIEPWNIKSPYTHVLFTIQIAYSKDFSLVSIIGFLNGKHYNLAYDVKNQNDFFNKRVSVVSYTTYFSADYEEYDFSFSEPNGIDEVNSFHEFLFKFDEIVKSDISDKIKTKFDNIMIHEIHEI